MAAENRHLSVAAEPEWWTAVDQTIEEFAQAYESIIGCGIGDLLRDVWTAIRPTARIICARFLIATWSGADDELEFYGGLW